MSLVDYGNSDSEEETETTSSANSLFSSLPTPKSAKSSKSSKSEVSFTVPISIEKLKRDSKEQNDIDSDEEKRPLKKQNVSNGSNPLSFLPSPKYPDGTPDIKEEGLIERRKLPKVTKPVEPVQEVDEEQKRLKELERERKLEQQKAKALQNQKAFRDLLTKSATAPVTQAPEPPPLPSELVPDITEPEPEPEPNSTSTPPETASFEEPSFPGIDEPSIPAIDNEPLHQLERPSSPPRATVYRFNRRKVPGLTPVPPTPTDVVYNAPVKPKSPPHEPSHIAPSRAAPLSGAGLPATSSSFSSIASRVTAPPTAPLMPLPSDPSIARQFKDLYSGRANIVDVTIQGSSTAGAPRYHEPLVEPMPGFSGDQYNYVIPTRDARRQHQVSYLVWEAKQKAMELENKRAQSSKNRRETKNKYGW